ERRERERLPRERQRRAAQRASRRPTAVAAALPRPALPRQQRARLLADGADGILRGGQSRLEPDALALRVHVLRSGAALARRGAAARAAARRLPRLARRAGRRRAREHVARLTAAERQPPWRGDQPWPARGRAAT